MKSILCLVIILILTTAPFALADSTAGVDSLSLDSLSADLEVSETAVASTSLYPMSPERREKLVSYAGFTGIWRFANFLIGLAILGLILFTGLSARMRTWTSGIKNKFLALWAYLVLFISVDYLLNLPFSIYRSFIVEDSYGFLNQTFMAWWGEDLLNLLITSLIAIVPVFFFYRLVNKTRKWWLYFSLGSIPFVVLMIVIVPVLVAPMFNDYGPLEDKQLEAEIVALADQAGIEGADIFQVNASKQSTKINAYVTGLFNTKRIVLYDNLIDNFSLDEVKFVMAHEMGHYVMNHMWHGLGLVILFIMFAMWLINRLLPPLISKFQNRLGFDRLGDHASWPLAAAALTVIMFVFQPVTNSYSRHMEHQADIYGMEHSGVDGESAAIAFDKLSVYNLSDPDPHPIIEFWFYGHPSLKKRIAFVRNWTPNQP
jgi:Zn-dependent protease with chaperone function